jgi:hypothetical protein
VQRLNRAACLMAKVQRAFVSPLRLTLWHLLKPKKFFSFFGDRR